MFRFFRRKPLDEAHIYLDIAASILQARNKCEGKTHDDWGRVDATGAIRVAVWGVVRWDDLKPRKRRYLFWEKYDEVKVLLYEHLAAHSPDLGWDSNKGWMNVRLQKWSDSRPQHQVVDWMREAARVASGKSPRLGRFAIRQDV